MKTLDEAKMDALYNALCRAVCEAGSAARYADSAKRAADASLREAEDALAIFKLSVSA